jgi:hypothetical protein
MSGDGKLTQASAQGLNGLLSSKRRRDTATEGDGAQCQPAVRASQTGQPTDDRDELGDGAGALDASGWLQGDSEAAAAGSSRDWPVGEDAWAQDEGEEQEWYGEDEDDLWEDADGPLEGLGDEAEWSSGAGGVPMPTNGLPSGSLTLMLDPDESAAPPAAATSTTHVPEVLSREQEAVQKVIIKAARAAERQRRQRVLARLESVHRVGLMCWLGHGNALSAQASSSELHAKLMSVLPAHLAAKMAPESMRISALRTLMLWLPTYLGDAVPPPATSAPAQNTDDCDESSEHGAAQALRAEERRWMLLLLLQAARERQAAEWATGSASAASEALRDLRSVAPGGAAGLEPVSARASGTPALLQELAHEVHGASLLRPSEPRPPEAPLGTLGGALDARETTATQQLLLLIALLRGLGLTARLVVALQPPDRRPQQPKGGKGGKEGKARESAPAARPPHGIPCWGEVHLPAEERWVSFDPFFKPSAPRASRVACDAAEAIPAARILPRAAAARAYIVGFGASGPAVDVTARYVADARAALGQRTAADWWDAALLACASPVGAGAGAGSREVPVDLSGEAGPSGAAEEAEAAEMRARLASQPMPTSLAAFKKDPHYVLLKDVGVYQTLHPADTPAVGIFKGHKVYPRAAVQRLMTEDRWFRECRCVHPGETPAKAVTKGRAAGKRPASAIAAAAAAADADVPMCDAGGLTEQPDLFGEWQTYAYEPPTALNGVVPRSARGHVEMWTEGHLPLKTRWLRQPHALGVAKKLSIDAVPAMVGFDFRDGRSVPRFDGVIVCEEMADTLREAAAGVAEQEEDKQLRKRRKRAVAQWAKLLRSLRLKARLEADYVHKDD